MKKRAKLITTIASLCLAVALMAFGVYAATSVTMSITSQIEFSVQDVYCTVTGSARIYDSSPSGALADFTMTPYSARSYTLNNGLRSDPVGSLAAWTIKMHDPENDAEGVFTADPAYDLNHDVAEYVITVTNDSTTTIYVSLANDILPYVAGTRIAAQYQVGDAAAQTNRATNKGDMVGEPAAAAAANSVNIKNVALAEGESVVITLTRTLEQFSDDISITNSLYGTLTVSKNQIN